MKVIFLCGSLEPGCDGVGDYTCRLAAELTRQGCEVALLSLNDKYIVEELVEVRCLEEVSLRFFRLPSILPSKYRFERAHEWINEYNPNWISLQFVIFSFHSKGLPFGLSRSLKSIGIGRRWHIMFHELWVGMPITATKSHILWGNVQRHLVKDLIKTLKPEIIHTQCQLYVSQLKKLRFRPRLLPLFSNIPRCRSFIKRDNKVTLIHFGAIHPYAYVDEFIEEVVQYTIKHNVDLSLVLVGRSGPYLNEWINKCKGSGVNLKVLGEQTTETISEVLSKASIGVSTSAIPMVDKSGTVAAMLEHGLPVLCIGHLWQPRGTTLPKLPLGVFRFFKGCLEACFASPAPKVELRSVTTVSKMFFDDLKMA